MGVMASNTVFNTLHYDAELCINCKMCSIVCPHQVFARGDRVAELAHPHACMECGACMRNCPTGAISVDSGAGCAWLLMMASLTGNKDYTCGDRCGLIEMVTSKTAYNDTECKGDEESSCCG